MTDDEQNDTLPAPPLDAFAAVLALIALAVNPRETEARLRSLREHQATAAKATATLAAAKATADQETAAERTELAAERADIEKRRLAVHAAEGLLAEREKRHAELEKAWHDIGEPPEVLSGFRDAERPALYKALRAHGRLDDVAEPSEPLPDDNDPSFRGLMPANVTLARAAQSPPRSAAARRSMRRAMERY